MLFRGLQTGRVDEKGRLKLPVLVRQRIEDHYHDLHLFITSLDGDQVKIFPLKEWEVIEARLSEKSPDGKESDGAVKDKILFQTQRFGAEETLDNQGRILVPAALREAAGMRGEVKILWQSNHMLVLNAERFDDTSQQSQLTAEDRRYAANLGV